MLTYFIYFPGLLITDYKKNIRSYTSLICKSDSKSNFPIPNQPNQSRDQFWERHVADYCLDKFAAHKQKQNLTASELDGRKFLINNEGLHLVD